MRKQSFIICEVVTSCDTHPCIAKMASIITEVVVLASLLLMVSEAKVSETECTTDGTECPEHSTCDANALKCKCDDTYAEDTTNGATCVLTVSATGCTGDTCSDIENAYCVSEKCKCKEGYTEKANKCEKNKATLQSLSLSALVISLILGSLGTALF